MRGAWPALEFHRFSQEHIGFREARLGFGVPYVPLMRGEIVVDSSSAAIRVLGRANFIFFGFIAFFLGAGGASGALAAVLLLGIFVAVQGVRFGHVVRQLRELPDVAS
jgi:hypothetical protein